MHIGDNIRVLRDEMGISQKELEQRSGVSKTQISRLEAGKQNNPQIETVVALSTALGVSVEKLIFGENNSKDLTYMMKALSELDREEWRFCEKLIKTVLITSQAKRLDEDKKSA